MPMRLDRVIALSLVLMPMTRSSRVMTNMRRCRTVYATMLASMGLDPVICRCTSLVRLMAGSVPGHDVEARCHDVAGRYFSARGVQPEDDETGRSHRLRALV